MSSIPADGKISLLKTERIETTNIYLRLRGAAIQLSGFVCAFHPAALGLSPKYTIHTFINYSQVCAKIVFAL